MTKAKQLSLPHSIGIIVLSTILFSGTGYSVLKWVQKVKANRVSNEKYTIKTLLQTSSQKQALSSIYLEELMDLSSNVPSNVYSFDKESATQKLLSSPMIKEASIRIDKPDTIYVDYVIRHPLAWCFDYENIAIDEEGYLFPLYPFFSPKKLPELYFGLAPFDLPAQDERPEGTFVTPLRGKYVDLAYKLLDLLSSNAKKQGFFIKRIDVSNAFANSYGKREIVVIIENEIYYPPDDDYYLFSHVLRLSRKNYAQELGNYFSLRAEMIHQEMNSPQVGHYYPKEVGVYEIMIDLRVPGLAFVDEEANFKPNISS